MNVWQYIIICFLFVSLAYGDDAMRQVYPDRSNFQRGIQVAGGSIVKRIFTATKTVDPPDMPANSGYNFTISVPGSKVGDAVVLGLPPELTAITGMMFNGRVSANDTVEVRVRNVSSAAKDLDSNTFRAVVIGFDS